MNKIKILFVFFLFVLFGCNSSILDDPSTSIEFYVPELSYVKLTIENSYDTQIATIVDEELAAGRYSFNFETSDLAEGIYFYTLEMKGESGTYSKLTKYMLLIK
jgi:hypothetical protein